MERPTEVKVGPWVYRIRYYTDKKWVKAGKETHWGGESLHEEQQINLRKTPHRGEGSLKETLLHEILHCVFVVTALNHYTRPRRGDLDEYIISGMSPTLLAVLQDNPKVLAYLVDA